MMFVLGLRLRVRPRSGGFAPVVLGLALLVGGCSAERSGIRAEGIDVSGYPADVRADYEVFAQRCSKCHTLARPLNSGIDDDAYWAMYVARMRRQPASGISRDDEVTVLRFLHYYSIEQKRLKAKKAELSSPPPVVPSADGGT